MGLNSSQLVAVADSSQVSAARFAAHSVATAAGLAAEDVHRAGIVATELASNLIKHTPEGGRILFRLADDERGGLEITSIDHGPGIANVARALSDGYSTSGTLGGGLGAVRRMTDECDVYSMPGKGTAIAVRIRREQIARAPARLLVAGVDLALKGEVVCGDSWQSWAEDSTVRIALADGLGHGPEAARASQLAVRVLASARSTCLAAMQAAHLALRPTRGAAAALTCIDLEAGQVHFIGIGNIGCVLAQPGDVKHTVSMGGTLGHEARTFREFAYPWRRGETVAVLYSDGLSSHWSLDDYPGLSTRSPAVIAAVLFRDFSRGRDDVTVVVAKEAA